MLKRILVTILVSSFLYSCDYTPLYSSKSFQKINLKIFEIKGDQELNKYITSNLNRYVNRDGKNVKIDIDTKYSKNIASRNTKGSISNYKLLASATFNVEVEGEKKTISFNEDFIMKNLDDNFEKNNYEKTIKKNFSNSITNKLLLQISSMK